MIFHYMPHRLPSIVRSTTILLIHETPSEVFLEVGEMFLIDNASMSRTVSTNSSFSYMTQITEQCPRRRSIQLHALN